MSSFHSISSEYPLQSLFGESIIFQLKNHFRSFLSIKQKLTSKILKFQCNATKEWNSGSSLKLSKSLSSKSFLGFPKLNASFV
ncbi:hypothetical protein LEP1GSC170_1549 [Leptospira interrogans serovar Bataviae str. HAI135]|nr:hypothetical protein LEP1GSC170_1549 [Leptospira interrogans serovar Bataviae str. HAI135]